MVNDIAHFLTTLKTLVELHDADRFSIDDFVRGLETSGIDATQLEDLSNALLKGAQPLKKKKPISRPERSKKALQLDNVRFESGCVSEMQDWVLGKETRVCDLVGLQTSTEAFKSLSGLYSSLRQEEHARAITEVRRRFKHVAIFRGVKDAGYHTGERWVRGAKSQLTATLRSEQVVDADKEIEKNLERYVELGQGFNTWSHALGGDGYLLLLPMNLPESTYADRHFRKNVQGLAERFRTLNIDSLAQRHKVHELGDTISRMLRLDLPPWDPPSSQNTERRKKRRVSCPDECQEGETAGMIAPESNHTADLPRSITYDFSTSRLYEFPGHQSYDFSVGQPHSTGGLVAGLSPFSEMFDWGHPIFNEFPGLTEPG